MRAMSDCSILLVDSPDMLECPICLQYFHPVCIGVPVPDADKYAKVWACESCHKRPGMPPPASLHVVWGAGV